MKSVLSLLDILRRPLNIVVPALDFRQMGDRYPYDKCGLVVSIRYCAEIGTLLIVKKLT